MNDALLAVFLAFIGTVAGGLIAWWVAYVYFRKQDQRTEQIFEALAHFLEKLSGRGHQERESHYRVHAGCQRQDHGCNSDT